MQKYSWLIFILSFTIITCTQKEQKDIPEVLIIEETTPVTAEYEEPPKTESIIIFPTTNLKEIKLISNEKLNRIILSASYQASENIYYEELIKEFNYVRNPEKKYIYKFPNGNILGLLPIQNESLEYKHFNEGFQKSELFFINLNNGTYTVKNNDVGINFYFIQIDGSTSPWICTKKKNIYTVQEYNDDGLIHKELFFVTDGIIEQISIKKRDDAIFLIAESLDYEESYQFSEDGNQLLHFETRTGMYSAYKSMEGYN